MTRLRPVKRIAIFGHVGTGNLGDETILAAVIQNIRHHYPDAEIHGFTTDPDDTRRRHRIPAFPIRIINKKHHETQQEGQSQVNTRESQTQENLYKRIKTQLKTHPQLYSFLRAINNCLPFCVGMLRELSFLIRSLRNLRGTDFFVVAGSGQLTDLYGGAWAYPYTILKWILMARLARAKVIVLSVGAGPIASPLSRLLFKYALSFASYRSYRDESSRRLIEHIGVSGEKRVFPDLAYSLRLGNGSLPPTRPPSPCIVGINPVPFCDDRYWAESDKATYQNYVQILALFTQWLLQRNHRVCFFPTQLRMDPHVISDIKLILRNNGGLTDEYRLIERPIVTHEDLIAQLSMIDIVVATRFHGILISYIMNKPVLGISYHSKIDNLMSNIGQVEFCLDIKRLSVQSLIERFTVLEAQRESIKQQIARRVSEYRQALEVQYDSALQME